MLSIIFKYFSKYTLTITGGVRETTEGASSEGEKADELRVPPGSEDV